jgi:flavin-dependent dehydrogenase
VCSVVIIGGGPAGSAAAIRCAQAGFAVTLVEAETFPRSHPGETLHPGVEPLFEQLGVAERVGRAGFLRQPGIQIERNCESAYEAYGAGPDGSWLGFQATRSVLDALLLERARECGARILQPMRARAPIIENGRVLGVVTDDGPIHADYTLDGTGDSGWLPRCLNLSHRTYSPRRFAQFGYATGSLPQELTYPLFRQTGRGWVWLARVGPEMYHWTRLVTTARFSRHWRPQEYAGLEPVGRTQARNVTWRHAQPVAGHGWFLMGDAAAILDPASSHGVLRALMSGIMAAQLVTGMRENRLSEAVATGVYQDWILDWFQHDVAKLKAVDPVDPPSLDPNKTPGL